MPRKPLAALAASVTVLALAGIALAHDKGPSSTQPVTATFSTATVSNLETSTCTGADGTYMQTKATYTGDSTSADPRLAGTLTIRAKTVYNTTTNLGYVEGVFRVESASGHAGGMFAAVDTAGALAGFMSGKAKDPRAKLLANFSATFDPATGFSAGQLGSGSSPDTAVVASGSCSGEHGDNGEHKDNKGKKHDRKNGKHDHKGAKK
jgi:hypothetical protein